MAGHLRPIFRFPFIEHKMAMDWAVACHLHHPKINRHGCGIDIEFLAVEPWRGFIATQHMAVAYPSYPIPSQHLDLPKPWGAKSRIADDNRAARLRQHSLQPGQKCAVCRWFLLGVEPMDFFIERHGTPLQCYRSTQ